MKKHNTRESVGEFLKGISASILGFLYSIQRDLLHPILKLKYFWFKGNESLIPKDTPYCYTWDDGDCPYIVRLNGKKTRTMSPIDGFYWCKYINAGDDLLFNDMCKMCGVSDGMLHSNWDEEDCDETTDHIV